MNKIKKHKFNHLTIAIIFIAMAVVLIVFRNKFLETFIIDDVPLVFPILFLASVSLGILIVLYFSLKEIFKSNDEIRNDYVNKFNRQIKAYEDIIYALKKEIEKYG